ncbi:MAG: isochorismatase family protein [Thermaerobacter sp.]|nr:isochorismatase family protein [Thermaerobacter sp.]
MADIAIQTDRTALVVIDLQKGIVQYPVKPHPAEAVVARAAALAQAMRTAAGFVVLVRVASHDGRDLLRPDADMAPPNPTERPADWSEIVPQLGPEVGDYVLTKRQWGAFYGTDLDLQLRRRNIDTIILCGIATGIGVDTTAREAYQRGYRQIFAVDAMSGVNPGEHEYVTSTIFPRIGRVTTTQALVDRVLG